MMAGNILPNDPHAGRPVREEHRERGERLMAEWRDADRLRSEERAA